MVAAGQNLKRLIKHNLGMLFLFSNSPFSVFDYPIIPDFFNRLVYDVTSWLVTCDTEFCTPPMLNMIHFLIRSTHAGGRVSTRKSFWSQFRGSACIIMNQSIG